MKYGGCFPTDRRKMMKSYFCYTLRIFFYRFCIITSGLWEWKLLLWSAEFCDAQVCSGRRRCDHLSAVQMRSLFSAVSPNFLKGQNRGSRAIQLLFSFPRNTRPSFFYVHSKIYSAVSFWFWKKSDFSPRFASSPHTPLFYTEIIHSYHH